MEPKKPRPTVWMIALNIISFAFFFLLFGFVGALLSPAGGGAAAGVTALILLALVVVGILVFKQVLATGIPVDARFVPTYVDAIGKADREGLKRNTEALEALGFRPVMDYALEADKGIVPQSYTRLMLHDEQRCYAEVSQLLLPQKFVPVSCGLITVFDNGWMLTTTDKKMDGGTWHTQGAKQARIALDKAPVTELWENHLAHRERIARETGGQPAPASLEAYIENEHRTMREMQEALRKQNPFGFVWKIVSFKPQPRMEWLGGLEKA